MASGKEHKGKITHFYRRKWLFAGKDNVFKNISDFVHEQKEHIMWNLCMEKNVNVAWPQGHNTGILTALIFCY